jgi:hypothetical protein
MCSYSSSLHGKIQECFRDLNYLYLHYPQFWHYGEEDFSLIYEYGPNLVVADHRGIYNNRCMVVIHDFSNRGYKSYDVSLPISHANGAHIRSAVEIFNTDHTKFN